MGRDPSVMGGNVESRTHKDILNSLSLLCQNENTSEEIKM